MGPVLAAQMGYLPGMLWILAGVVFAGAVQDFIVLFMSMRRDGRSLGDLIKSEMGEVPGVIALFGTFMIMVIILAVLALIVVKALTASPWGSFTVMATIPIALFMGVYSRFVRVGRIGEISLIGFVLLMLAIVGGQWVHHQEPRHAAHRAVARAGGARGLGRGGAAGRWPAAAAARRLTSGRGKAQARARRTRSTRDSRASGRAGPGTAAVPA